MTDQGILGGVGHIDGHDELSLVSGAVGSPQPSDDKTSVAAAERLKRAERFEMLKEEHRTARAELLWRLNGIYDVQKAVLPLIVALMVALSYAGAETGKFQKTPLVVGWVLIPIFFLLAITKLKHHRQRNRELSGYIMFIEMVMYDRFPHSVLVRGLDTPALSVLIGRDQQGDLQWKHLSAADVGWEHFIRSNCHILPKIVDQLEAEGQASKKLADDCGVPKTIASMSRIELNYMACFMIFAVLVSGVQIFHILGIDVLTRFATDLVHVARDVWYFITTYWTN